mgnify:CR=1 FL=1
MFDSLQSIPVSNCLLHTCGDAFVFFVFNYNFYKKGAVWRHFCEKQFHHEPPEYLLCLQL